MTAHVTTQPPSVTAADHAATMGDYLAAGEARAYELGNRGPIRFGTDGKLHPDILTAYWQHGFYVFEGVIGAEELADLRADVDRVVADSPATPDGELTRDGRPTADLGFEKPTYRFAKPLSDPYGGTTKNKGRHPVAMVGPTPEDDAPEWTIEILNGNLQLMDSTLRLYGHPGLLAIAEAVNGADFVPYNEVTFIKEPGLGPSIAWHQDGTTHWDAPDWDQGAHGFNFMTQLYASTPANCVWVLPGTHKSGKVDIKQLVAESGSERIDTAVPLVCEPGDVMILNRQCVHGSFANTSPHRRVTLNAGFFPRRRVLDVTTSKLNDEVDTYTKERITQRCRIIALGIDARAQNFPSEPRYRYQPLADCEEEVHWSEETRETILKNYNLLDMYI